jgi:hypothetical protein
MTIAFALNFPSWMARRTHRVGAPECTPSDATDIDALRCNNEALDNLAGRTSG